MRLIDADELKTAFPTCDNSKPVLVDSVRATINNMPTVEEQKTGRWIHKGGGSFICSDCGEMVGLNTYRSERACEIFLYCPHCGARMKGDENETG